jgi:hypothetical protein
MKSKERKENSNKVILNENKIKNNNLNDSINKTENYKIENNDENNYEFDKNHNNFNNLTPSYDFDNNNHIIEKNSSENLKIHLTFEQLIMAYNQFEDNNNKKEIIGGIIQNLSSE